MNVVLKVLGVLLIVSGFSVALPQLLNFVTFLYFRGWVIQFPFADDITHYGGMLFGSLAIPTYKEYYELGLIGFGLILVAIIGVKFGFDLFRLRIKAFYELLFLALAVVILFIILLVQWGFYLEVALFGFLPPLFMMVLTVLGRKELVT